MTYSLLDKAKEIVSSEETEEVMATVVHHLRYINRLQRDIANTHSKIDTLLTKYAAGDDVSELVKSSRF